MSFKICEREPKGLKFERIYSFLFLVIFYIQKISVRTDFSGGKIGCILVLSCLKKKLMWHSLIRGCKYKFLHRFLIEFNLYIIDTYSSQTYTFPIASLGCMYFTQLLTE
jgi:hypothetical protein